MATKSDDVRLSPGMGYALIKCPEAAWRKYSITLSDISTHFL